jgi:hypothetical protein
LPSRAVTCLADAFAGVELENANVTVARRANDHTDVVDAADLNDRVLCVDQLDE